MGTKTEQSRLLLVWVICAQCASFLFKHFVYIALCFMSKEDVMAVSKQIHRSYEGPTSVDDADDASSQWSYVSEIDGKFTQENAVQSTVVLLTKALLFIEPLPACSHYQERHQPFSKTGAMLGLRGSSFKGMGASFS